MVCMVSQGWPAWRWSSPAASQVAISRSAEGVGLSTPGEAIAVDRVVGAVLVGPQESVGEAATDGSGGGADGRGSAEGWVGEHEAGERKVVVRVGEDSG